MKRMNLTEATIKALQKEDKATNGELLHYTNLYRISLEYLEYIYDIMEGAGALSSYSFSDTYYDAEEEFIEKLLDEKQRIEKLLGETEKGIIGKK